MITLQDTVTVVNSYLPEPHASLLSGIVFGIDVRSSEELFLQLKKVGLLHVVVLSGTNINLLSSFILFLTSWLPKKISLLITIFSIGLFVCFVGIQPPALRAALTGSLNLLAVYSGRKASCLYILCLSAVMILIFKPDWLTSISFQLSYGASLGIILCSGKKISVENPLLKMILTDLKTTLSAQLFTTPIIYFYFNQISFIAPVANILTGFIIGPLMIVGFLTVLFGSFFQVAGLMCAYIAYGLLSYFIFIVSYLSKIPWGYMGI